MHFSYPFPIPCLPAELELASRKKNDEGNNEEIEPVSMNDKEDLDMLYYQPFLNGPIAKELFLFLRKELPFYRVEYKINRGGDVTNVKTPRLYVLSWLYRTFPCLTFCGAYTRVWPCNKHLF